MLTDRITAVLSDKGTVAWEHAEAHRETLEKLLISPLSEHDFLVVYGVWAALMDACRVAAAMNGVADQFDAARQFSESGFNFAHYVVNPMMAMPPEEVATFALEGFTDDVRRVWPLLEQHMPELAEKIRLTRL